LALGVRPADILNEPNTTSNETQEVGSANVASILRDVSGQPPIQSTSGQDDDRGPDFQAHKAAFFFKLERELEKVHKSPYSLENSLYIQSYRSTRST
jgi:CDK inhibitor PHO81